MSLESKLDKETCSYQQPRFLILCYIISDLVKSRRLPNPLLDTDLTGTCGSNRNIYCRHLRSWQQPLGSVNLELQPSKIQVWRASCRDSFLPELQDKVKLTLSCLGGHLQQGDIESSPIVLGEQASMEKTTQRFQRIATTLADLNAEGLNAQTVNDLLSMYVGAGSQHVLRVSF